ncbi:MAG: glycosyltransferase, partial [Candidatus Marsarchaeota archaeon]|nr:glycosyltransferase [Candidatus Marsarchaeota archaeon]
CARWHRPQEDEVRAKSLGNSNAATHFIPWLQIDGLPLVYGLAKCFILPSTDLETWGLVVNEAMASRLPVLVSRRCGCWPELCWRGINGFDFDPADVDRLAGLMLRMSGGQVDLQKMGQASHQIISNFTPVTWAAALADCAETLVGLRRTRKPQRVSKTEGTFGSVR